MTDTRSIADVSRVVSVQESIGTIVNGHSHYTHVVSVENSVVMYSGTSDKEPSEIGTTSPQFNPILTLYDL